jgi:hypothetical protein
MNFDSPKGAWRIGVMTSCLGGMTGYRLKKVEEETVRLGVMIGN